MPKLLLGAIAGIVYGAIDVLIMLPMPLPDKRRAMFGAFINRFAIGFLIGASNLPLAPWLAGIAIGLLLSLPDAIITKVYAPIIAIGVIGGGIIGLAAGIWGV